MASKLELGKNTRQNVNAQSPDDMICKIYEFFDKEYTATRRYKLPDLQNVLERTSKATGVSEDVINKYLQTKTIGPSVTASKDSQVSLSDQNTKKKNDFGLNFNNEEYQAIREIITDMQVRGTELPTTARLLSKLESSFGFSKSPTELKSILKLLKFKVHKNVITESNSERLKRIKFLKEMQALRDGVKSFDVFVYVKVGLLILPGAEDESYLIAFAAGPNGFLKNTLLVQSFVVETSDAVCTFCEKWLREKLICNIPINSILLIEETTYKRMCDKLPKWHSSRDEMVAWLNVNNIQIDRELLKLEIYQIVKQHKANYIQYEYGLRVLKIQRYHPRLNTLEMIQPKIQEIVGKYHWRISNALDVKSIVNEYLCNTKREVWLAAFRETSMYEKQVMKNEKLLDGRGRGCLDTMTVVYPKIEISSSDTDSADELQEILGD